MKILFIGHSHHLQTKSSEFFLQILQELGTVTCMWDEGWKKNHRHLSISEEHLNDADIVIFWQTGHLISELATRHQNVIFVPMYDGSKDESPSFWKKLARVKILCFCAAMHERATAAGAHSLYVRYFPPLEAAPVSDWSTLRGFFWQRTSRISWHQIATLNGKTHFGSFTVHRAMDPGLEHLFVAPDSAVKTVGTLRITDWFPKKSDLIQCVRESNVYYAPRLDEGIGMSFLEAMALGQLVVAPDRPTMNEYITHGINGLLYDPARCTPLDFTCASAIGNRARRCAENGRARWLRSIPDLKTFISTPSTALRALADCEAGRPLDGISPRPGLLDGTAQPLTGTGGGYRTKGKLRPTESTTPLVTVVTVTYNPGDNLARTVHSVTEQTYPNIEYIVIDGGSTDGTVEQLARHDRLFDLWISERDAGPYDAMNKAAHLARGRWIIFMNAGDRFASPHAIADALHQSPEEADFIIGHHFYRSTVGVEYLHKAADFEETWQRLRGGRLNDQWKTGIPCHQSTFTRTALLRAHGFDLSYRITADHDFMYRMRALGARFHHADTIIAVYSGGGLSWANQEHCETEWLRTALEHTEHPQAIREYYRRRMDDRHLSAITQGDWDKALKLIRNAPRLAYRATKRACGNTTLPGLLRQLAGVREQTYHFKSGHSCVAQLSEGLSYGEDWGTWSDGDKVVIPFGKTLTGKLEISIHLAHIYATCRAQPITLKVGNDTRQITLPNQSRWVIKQTFQPDTPAKHIEIHIHHAAEKGSLPDKDTRRLGLGLEFMTIRHHSD